MWIPALSALFFKWSKRDAAILTMFAGLIFIFWFFMGIWLVGMAGILILIIGLMLLLIK